jgi:hypothetical protein
LNVEGQPNPLEGGIFKMSGAYVLVIVLFVNNPGGNGSIAMHDFETKDACEKAQQEIYNRRTSDQWPSAQVEVCSARPRDPLASERFANIRQSMPDRCGSPLLGIA